MNKNLYEVLGVEKTASTEEIKKAYKKLAQLYHPDMHTDASAEELASYEEKFKEINNAHEILSNTNSRAEYDRQEATKRNSSSSQSSSNNYQSSYSNSSNTNNQTRYSSQTNSARQKSTSDEDDWETVEVNYSELFWDFVYKTKEDYKEAWKEIRKEEKNDPLKRRHAKLNKSLRDNFYPSNDKVISKIGYGIFSGVAHISYEFIHELAKLRYIKEDTIPKFVVRNRNAIATILTASIILTSAGAATAEPIEQPDQITTAPTQPIDGINQNVTIYRKYEIQFGDTLTKLAEDANTTAYDIASYNGLSVNDLIIQGTQITIPYRYNEEDLDLVTRSVSCEEDDHISKIADEYDTTTGTLRTLNEEAIDEYGDILSSTILVPTFPSREELQEKRSNEYSYRP